VYEYPLVRLFVAEYVAVRKKNTAGYTPKNHSLNLLRKSVYYEMRELARSRRPRYIDGGHPCVRGPFAAPAYEFLNHVYIALRHCLYRAVRVVPHPPGQPELLGLTPGRGPVENPLNPAFDD